MLSTIRVPKNLLYLTDRLPKPSYDSVSNHGGFKKKTESVEKRRTTEGDEDKGSVDLLPEMKKNAKSVPKKSNETGKHKNDADSKAHREASLPVLREQQQESEVPTSGNDQPKPNSSRAKNSSQMPRN